MTTTLPSYKCSQIPSFIFSNPGICADRKGLTTAYLCTASCPGPIPLGEAPWPTDDIAPAKGPRLCQCGQPVESARASKCTSCLNVARSRGGRKSKIVRAKGIAAAKVQGVKRGRPANPLPLDFPDVLNLWRVRAITAKEAAQRLNMPYSSFIYRTHQYTGGAFDKPGPSR